MSKCNCYMEYEYEHDGSRAPVIGEYLVICDECYKEEWLERFKERLEHDERSDQT